MKRIIILLIAILFVAGFTSITKVKDPKQAVCIEACKAALEECQKKAAKNDSAVEKEAANLACKATYDECEKKCKK